VSNRTTLVLLGILVALGVVAFVVQGPCSSDRAREHAAVFPKLDPAEVRTLRAKLPGGGELLLAREGAGWVLGAGKEPADMVAVNRLLTDLAALQASAVVSKNAAKQSVYETDPAKGIAVRLEGAGAKLIAAFVVGKRGPDYASSYLRREDAKEVLLVSRDVRADLSRPAESWRAPPDKPAEKR
jgi:hypothetical protein